jgi:hypothetical protein
MEGKDSETEEDPSSKVTFPSNIMGVIIRNDFLAALYASVNRLLEVKNYEFFDKCLDCLEKILSVRKSTIPGSLMVKFLGVNLRGIVELL